MTLLAMLRLPDVSGQGLGFRAERAIFTVMRLMFERLVTLMVELMMHSSVSQSRVQEVRLWGHDVSFPS